MNRLIPIVFPILSGLLYVFSFAPWNQGYLQWFAFAPLFIAADSLKTSDHHFKRKLFLTGYALSLSICVGGFYWIIYATQQYGGLPLPVALGTFLLFCIFMQLQVPLYLMLRSSLLRTPVFQARPGLWFILSGLAYAGIESIYPKIFLDTAGNAFSNSVYFRQIADIGGPFLLTWLVIVVGELLAASYRATQKRRIALVTIAFTIIAATHFYGVMRVNQIHKLETTVSESSKLKISMIQANIGDFMKVAAERGSQGAAATVMDQYMGLSQKAVTEQKPDAIIWPETAYPAIFDLPLSSTEKLMDDQMKGFLQTYRATVPHGTFMFGGYDQDEARLDYNSLFFYHQTEDGPLKRVYHKSVLLMFGETLPFAETFPSMKSWFPMMGFFGRGPGPTLYTVKNANGLSFRLAPSICYEGLFTDHSVVGAIMGADALVNVTNDSWFGPYGEPHLHLALTVFRSIETRLPMLRSTNTGFTTLIDSTGELTQKTNLFQSEILTVSIPPRLQITSPYLWVSRYLGARWFVHIAQAVALILFGIALRHSKFKS